MDTLMTRATEYLPLSILEQIREDTHIQMQAIEVHVLDGTKHLK